MPFVLDASVALSWLFEEELSSYADAVAELTLTDGALVPSIWPIEVANGLVMAERCGRLSAADLAQAVDLSLGLPIVVRGATLDLALRDVVDLARNQRLTAYDAAYLALAMREGLALATQDAGLRAAAGRVGVPLLDVESTQTAFPCPPA